MSDPPGSAGAGHGPDPEDADPLLRRIREFLRHGDPAEAGVEEWGEFAAQLRFLREELPRDEQRALLAHWERVLVSALPDLTLAAEQRESVLLALEAAAAEGAAWASLEQREPSDEGPALAPVLRPSLWTLGWVAPGSDGGAEPADQEHEHEPEENADEVLVLTAADARTEVRCVLADRLVLAHLAADVRGLLAEGHSLPVFPQAERVTPLPSLRVDAEAGFACTGFSIRGLPAIGLQATRNAPPLAFLVLDVAQLSELLERARALLGTSA